MLQTLGIVKYLGLSAENPTKVKDLALGPVNPMESSRIWFFVSEHFRIREDLGLGAAHPSARVLNTIGIARDMARGAADKSRLASWCAPRVASWCPCTSLSARLRAIRGAHACKFVESAWREGGGLPHHTISSRSLGFSSRSLPVNATRPHNRP